MRTRVIQDDPEPSEPGVPGDVEAAPGGRLADLPEDGSASGGADDAADARVVGDPLARERGSNGGSR
jgi:hypothetical protein